MTRDAALMMLDLFNYVYVGGASVMLCYYTRVNRTIDNASPARIERAMLR